VARLDSFDAQERRAALEELAGGPEPHWRAEVNLHCHTFFSYNARGYSPSRVAWEAFDYGLEVTAIVDFDVLDGVAEFLGASQLLGLKCAAGLESRVFVEEYRDSEINPPHEPGVYYLAGLGFTGLPEPGTAAAGTLADMADCARRRNVAMIERVNAHLDAVTIDYERDVLPLTPKGNATERHMLVAYERRAREILGRGDELARFWSAKLEEPLASIRELLGDAVALKGLIRSRLMKFGGPGYAAPGEGSFPRLDDAVAMILSCGGVPSACWLDGTSAGEADPVAHFAFMRAKGIPTVTIIPDRNWNISDPDERALKVENLGRAMKAAAELEMPVLVGTEMNKDGQKFVDTFDAPALAPWRQAFLDAGHLIWGHTLLKMTCGVGFTGPWAEAHFGPDKGALTSFFRRVGERPFPSPAVWASLQAAGADVEPDDVLAFLSQ